ncbi:beta-ketoacyl synthase [Marinospirillum alkaliphilum]|uniref:3-oxoacyl-(Acyl-carrier-protein) synthase n=1 Tax=Marinospirillum alkaliphilum DSM 21637 TaxID=1122209 RepID=A0A1K1Z6U9_9GAMM|nr:beta-ketoacyl synthase [Marinospirillum alkaliphilum]SFX70002.1 3-oxoacyl-(acyl-carrier-protein) synthase [Marinospirillum alkaliphilum DSM 21637]
MSHLPVIIGMGGVSPAGRTSGHHAFRRMLLDQLPAQEQQASLLSLISLTGLARKQSAADQWLTHDGQQLNSAAVTALYRQQLLDNTLIRRIHPDWFDVHAHPGSRAITLQPGEDPICFRLRRRQLPERIPVHWQLRDVSATEVEVLVTAAQDMLIDDPREALVQAAGLLPTGFDPGAHYRSANHPRALQMAVFGASDLLGQTGIEWQVLSSRVRPDQIGVFASNSIGQLDQEGWGGLLQSPVTGKRTTSKQMPLGYAQMTADFINAYMLGNIGQSSGLLGACATFLYNLQAATNAIRSGRLKIALVGTSDAPVTPEIIEGFRAMGALADNISLRTLDGVEQLEDSHYRRACRPFADNCGFTIAESAQFTLLVADDLAIETGAQILGSVPEVFANADGFKRSISAPGIGNYLTLAKAAALGRSLLGEKALRERSFIHAHGTSTPKNRVTESHVINEVAKAMGIESWPVAAIKAFVGHSQGTAGGDQFMSALGTWSEGWLPGITTVENFASDIHASNLLLSNQHREVGQQGMDMALLNAKGFGGNNASALLLAPHITEQMLTRRYGQQSMADYRRKLEQTRVSSQAHEQAFSAGQFELNYQFGEKVLEGEELSISSDSLSIPGYPQPVNLKLKNPFDDML